MGRAGDSCKQQANGRGTKILICSAKRVQKYGMVNVSVAHSILFTRHRLVIIISNIK